MRDPNPVPWRQLWDQENDWLAFLILLLLRRGHPGPLDDVSPVSFSRKIIAVVLVVIFALSVVPFGFSCQ